MKYSVLKYMDKYVQRATKKTVFAKGESSGREKEEIHLN